MTKSNNMKKPKSKVCFDEAKMYLTHVILRKWKYLLQGHFQALLFSV